MIRMVSRLAAYVILTTDSHILLVQNGKGHNPFKWGLPGGGVEFGEDPPTALKREVLEETNLKLEKFELFGVTSVQTEWSDAPGGPEHLHNVGIIYQSSMQKIVPVKEEEDGHGALQSKWFLISDLNTIELTSSATQALKTLIE